MREEGIRKSDDRTISHPHGYWFSGTGYSKFGRKSSAERSGGRLLGEATAVASVHQFIFVFTCSSGEVSAEGRRRVRLRQLCVSSERMDVCQRCRVVKA